MATLPTDVFHCIAKHIVSKTDLSVLCRCNRAWNEIAIPHLYYSLNFSVHEAHTFAEITYQNDLFGKHCRQLVVTSRGQAEGDDGSAYEDKYTEDLDKRAYRARESIDFDLYNILRRCSSRGLIHFSWDIDYINRRTSWLLNATHHWRCLQLSRGSIRSLDINLDGDEGACKDSLVSGYVFILFSIRLIIYFRDGFALFHFPVSPM